MRDQPQQPTPASPAAEPRRANEPRSNDQPRNAAQPRNADEAVELVLAGLGWLASADLASAPASVQADCLRGLERAASVHTAARSAVLAAFDAGGGFEDDGCGTARTWLRWQTRTTRAAASATVGWMRRLRAHRAVWAALRAGEISVSWAREICDLTDKLPESARADADLILLAAAAGGAELDDLALLADQMRRSLATPDSDGGDDGFDDRQVRLQTTFGGAGRLEGDLTPSGAAALQAVLDALGKRAGPEDLRTPGQRRHDALVEACRRLIAAGGLPDRAGQPTQIQLHLSLEELTRRLDGTPGPDIPDPPDGSDPIPPPVLPWPAAAPGTECDATIMPVVTGHVDHDLLDKLTALLTRRLTGPGSSTPGSSTCDHCGTGFGPASQDQARDQIRDLITASAVALLSGPRGLASLLRTGTLAKPAASVSLPLDVGTSTDTIPAHLRRAVILRDKHCAAPGCHQPPSGCQIHHLRPRSKGGTTSLTNMALLCTFHHLILVHQWGWTINLNPDGTTTMRSPDGTRVYHSHSPPVAA